MTAPTITVPEGTRLSREPLVGIDGNGMSVIGVVRRGLRRADNPPEILTAFSDQAMDGDYDHLLLVALAFTDSEYVS